MKIAVVVGHTSGRDGGAFSPTLNLTEFNYNIQVANELKKLSPQTFDIYTSDIQDYYKRQQSLAKEINSKSYDLVLELHFNSFSETSTGVETLYYYSNKKAKEWGQIISKEIGDNYKMKLRGNNGVVAISKKGERGYWFFASHKHLCLLVEPFFGSNPTDCEKFKDPKQYACVLFNALNKLK